MKPISYIEDLRDLVVNSLIGECITLRQAASIRFIVDTLSIEHLLYVATSLGVIDDTKIST